jgi:mannose-6-phosphate isomerase
MSTGRSSLRTTWAPFLIEPIYDKRVWGFRDLRPWFDYIAQGETVGEVWLTGDECRVATGQFAGCKLGELFHRESASLLGRLAPSPDSPLLIKVLFAREKLSVQVHPDDAHAQKYGQPRGKTECWYALAAEPGAQVALGLKHGVRLADIEADIHNGTLEKDLGVVAVNAGDLIFVDAGTVHTILPGSILLEVQQNCDITYRLFDYGRPRELHIEKGLEAVKFTTKAGKVAPQRLADRTLLIDSDYFRMEKISVSGRISSRQLDGDSSATGERRDLSFLFAAAGRGGIHIDNALEIEKEIILEPRSIAGVPAASAKFEVLDRGGLELIRITPKWPASQKAQPA